MSLLCLHAAIDSSILLLEASHRWPELVAALDMRAQKNVSTAQKRTDLTRIAVVYRDHIKDTERAIGAWQRRHDLPDLPPA